MSDPFEGAEIISSYSRAQAIEDGMLVDISEMAREAGFKFPTVLTQAVFAVCTPPKGNRIQSFAGRAWDVLTMAGYAMRRYQGKDRAPFVVKIGAKNHHMLVHCGPGDDAAPVLTIGFPSDF